MTNSLRDRFFSRFEKQAGGCWIWTGCSRGNGYGGIHLIVDGKRRMIGAHKASFYIHNGYLPPSSVDVCHTCDTRKCVNPDHLFLGSRSDNMMDAANKGRITTIGKSRMTHCKNGHIFSEQNTITRSNGHRRCRECTSNYPSSSAEYNRDRMREHRAAIRARGQE